MRYNREQRLLNYHLKLEQPPHPSYRACFKIIVTEASPVIFPYNQPQGPCSAIPPLSPLSSIGLVPAFHPISATNHATLPPVSLGHWTWLCPRSECHFLSSHIKQQPNHPASGFPPTISLPLVAFLQWQCLPQPLPVPSFRYLHWV